MHPMLSPLNLSALILRLPDLEVGGEPDTNEAQRSRVQEVVRYECLECHEEHEDWQDAADCCPPDDAPPPIEHCPICDEKHADTLAAASCCLWKELDEPTRAELARAVEGGMRWSQALKPYLPEHIQARIK